MANAVLWTAKSAEIKVIEDAEPAATATVAGTLDNTTNKYRWADLQLKAQFASAPTAGGVFTCWMVPRSVWNPDAAAIVLDVPIGSFPVVATTDAQILAPIKGIPLEPVVYDIVLKNNTSQNASTDSVQLSATVYTEEVQS